MAEKQDRERKAKWLRLHLAEGVGSVTFRKLLEAFGGIDAVLAARAGELMSVSGIGQKKAEQIAASLKTVDVEEEMAVAEKLGVEIVTQECAEYPAMLKQIYDPSAVLYVKGRFERADALSVAIVGSRHCSFYGKDQASRLGHLLAAAGFTIVSGLARGIDTAAHQGALAAGGRTIAVLGCGLANMFPEENADLAQEIAEHGAVVSELPMRFEPLTGTFHARNRIISGLSLGTLVVEAGRNSGAMITAKFAVEQNREVMAVPGQIDSPGSAGCHRLIKDGAALIENIDDVLSALGRVGEGLQEHAGRTTERAQEKVEPGLFDIAMLNLSDDERALIEHLAEGAIHIDELISRSRQSASKVNAAMVSLQLKGVVKQLPGGYYQRKKIQKK